MNSKVTDLSTRRPHLEGPAKCLNCNYTWRAVSKVGVYSCLECPECKMHKGVRTSTVTTPKGGEQWICNCGCDLFELRRFGPVCVQCGIVSEDYIPLTVPK